MGKRLALFGFVASAVAILASVVVSASETWMETYEGPDYGAFFDMILSDDGHVLVVGATNHLHFPPYSGDALLMQLTLEGEIVWEKAWGGDGYEQASSVVPASDGGYFVFGETDSHGAGGRDFFLLKVAEDGTEEWFETYGGPDREWPFGMISLSNGDVLMHGFTTAASGARRQYAVRATPDGSTVWEYIRGDAAEEIVLDALETAAGDIVLCLSIDEDGGSVKLDANGDVLWSHRYELAGWQFPSQIASLDDGGFLLAGFVMAGGSRRQADTWLVRCSASGEIEWHTSFGDSIHDDYAQSLLRLNDGTYLIGGLGNGMPLFRVDEDGTVLWRRYLTKRNVYGAEALIELDGGGFLVAGFIQIVSGRSYDAILMRTDAEGRVNE